MDSDKLTLNPTTRDQVTQADIEFIVTATMNDYTDKQASITVRIRVLDTCEITTIAFDETLVDMSTLIFSSAPEQPLSISLTADNANG